MNSDAGLPQVCVITSVHRPFDGRIFHRQCQTLARAGYCVTLIAQADFERQQQEGVTVLGVRRAAVRLQRPLVWWRLFRRTWRLHPEVIHFHDPELLLLVPLFHLFFGGRVKIVYDVHEYFVDMLAGKFWIPRWLRSSTMSVVRFLEKLLVRGVDGIVCAVDGQKPLYADFAGPLAVVRNYPFASLFEGARPHPDLDAGGLKLIYVGLLLPERGINVLLEAMHLLHQQGLEDVHLFLVGPETSADYMAEIQAFAQAHQLDGRVHWLGYIAHGQLKHYLANAHVGLVPGLRTRQFRNPGISTKLLEYLLCGLPVISVDHPHHRVFVEESNCGLLVPPSDASAHAAAILWMYNHPDEVRAMGQRGRAMVLDRYTWEQEEKRLLAFYANIRS